VKGGGDIRKKSQMLAQEKKGVDEKKTAACEEVTRRGSGGGEGTGAPVCERSVVKVLVQQGVESKGRLQLTRNEG